MSQADSKGIFVGFGPMLANRTVMMTICATANGQLMVSVIPKKVKDDENDALTTPLSLVGTAEELDRDLPTQIRDFVEAHATTVSNLNQIKQELAVAEKAAEEARKEKMKAKRVPPAEKAPPPATQEPQATLGLFDAPDASVPRDPAPPTAASLKLHPAIQTGDHPE